MGQQQRDKGGHPWLWGALGVLGGLYIAGRRERPAERQLAVEMVDEPDVVDAWLRVNRLPQFRAMREFITRRALQGRSQARVLDVGSGAGQLAIALAARPAVERVVGIDISGDLVKRARQEAEARGANAEFLLVDGADMPFPDNSFDVVVSTISFHHWQNPQQVLSEIHRVLAPGGRALIFDFRRDASTLVWGVATMITRFIAPRPIRESGEPLASLKSAYTPCEAVLLAVKAGWTQPRVTQGPLWMVMELDKHAAALHEAA